MKKEITDLQNKINAIDKDPRKEPSDEAKYFIEIVCSKLFDLNAPPEVANLLRENVTRLHTSYDPDSDLDMAALNNKIIQINDLAIRNINSDNILPSNINKKILRIMSVKQ